MIQLAVLYSDRLSDHEQKFEAVSSTIDAKVRVKRAMSRDEVHEEAKSPHEIAAIQRRWGNLLQESEDVFLSPGVDSMPERETGDASPLRPNSDIIVSNLRERLREEKEANEDLKRENILLSGSKYVAEHSLEEKRREVKELQKALAASDAARQKSFARSLAIWHRGWLQKLAAKQFYKWKTQYLQRRLDGAEHENKAKDNIIDSLEIEAAATVKEASDILVQSQRSMKSLKQRQALCAADLHRWQLFRQKTGG